MDQLRTERAMKRLECQQPRCGAIWVEKPDGTFYKETENRVCFGLVIGSATVRVAISHNLLKEITQ